MRDERKESVWVGEADIEIGEGKRRGTRRTGRARLRETYVQMHVEKTSRETLKTAVTSSN